MRDGAKARKALLAAQNSKLAQQLADVKKQVATNFMSLPAYRSKVFSDIKFGFKEFCRRLLDSAGESVKSR